MARKKTAADEIYNARRRARRQVARLEKQLKSQVGASKVGTEKLISALQKNISKTYAKSGATAAEITRTANVLNTATQKKTTTATGRKNRMFQERLKNASNRTKIKESDVHIFYAATRRIWEGASSSVRNDLIMQELGATSLEEAFNAVMAANEKARKMARGQLQQKGFTDENKDFYEGMNDEIEAQVSPDYLDVVVVM